MEAPIMFGVSILAARWVVRHVGIPPLRSRRLALGCIALALMFLVEFTLVLWIRGLTIRGYFEARDPVSGTVVCFRQSCVNGFRQTGLADLFPDQWRRTKRWRLFSELPRKPPFSAGVWPPQRKLPALTMHWSPPGLPGWYSSYPLSGTVSYSFCACAWYSGE